MRPRMIELFGTANARQNRPNPASEPQLTFIRRLLGDSAGDLDFDNLTKRDATIVIRVCQEACP